MVSKVYIGNLSSRVTERDVRIFFRGYGKIETVDVRSGHGFVYFCDYLDARDAVEDLDGSTMQGVRVIVKKANCNVRADFDHPVYTDNRIIVENLSTRCSWQDLKDLMRTVGHVTYADAHNDQPHTGIVCFRSYSDVPRAIAKLQGHVIHGRRIMLIDFSDDRKFRRSRSRSRFPSRRSRSRSSLGRSRSRSPVGRSRSRSPVGRYRSRSRRR